MTPYRQIRADFDDDTIVVHQAYSPQIAEPALAAGRFVPPFRTGRMTWIKPSFLWMMYRCGWAKKPGQERVLSVRITRAGFEQALAASCLSHFHPDIHGTEQQWHAQRDRSPVRVQWDPERSLRLAALPWRSLQVGLSGSAVASYVDEWTTAITDVTGTARRISALLDEDRDAEAAALLPTERPYPLPPEIGAPIGAGPWTHQPRATAG